MCLFSHRCLKIRTFNHAKDMVHKKKKERAPFFLLVCYLIIDMNVSNLYII